MSKTNKPILPDPNAPIVPEEVKPPETPKSRAEHKLKKEEKKVRQFKKDVKFLWIYSTIFCLVLFAMIGGSAVIQRKLHRETNELKNQVESAENTNAKNQSRLSNIQEENKQLKSRNELLEQKNKEMEEQAKLDGELIVATDKVLSELQKLSQVQLLYAEGKFDAARELIETLDADSLPEDAENTYKYYKEKLA